MTRWRGAALAGAALTAFLVAQLVVGASLGATRRQLDDGRRSLATVEVEHERAAAARAAQQDRVRAAEAGLDGLRTRLDQLRSALGAGSGPAVADLLADLEGARADLDGASAALLGRRSEVEALRSCFVSVTQALSLVSLDRRAEALDVLGTAAPRCREAEARR